MVPAQIVALLFDVSMIVTVPESAGFAFAGPTVVVNVTDWLTVEVREDDATDVVVPVCPITNVSVSFVLL